ncbi:hypothetical protein PENTCL1PPCAC_10964, partial [Pristionchus entomophagus]
SSVYSTPTTVIMQLYFLALIPMALACHSTSGIPSGPLTANPTLTFKYSPPVEWTYADKSTGGQAGSESEAKNHLNTDIELAVKKAIASSGALVVPSYTLKSIPEPEKIIINAGDTCTAPANGIVENGAVTKKCNDKEKTADAPVLQKQGSITVDAPLFYLYQSQWNDLAKSVQQRLTSNSEVKFHGDIEVE